MHAQWQEQHQLKVNNKLMKQEQQMCLYYSEDNYLITRIIKYFSGRTAIFLNACVKILLSLKFLKIYQFIIESMSRMKMNFYKGSLSMMSGKERAWFPEVSTGPRRIGISSLNRPVKVGTSGLKWIRTIGNARKKIQLTTFVKFSFHIVKKITVHKKI